LKSQKVYQIVLIDNWAFGPKESGKGSPLHEVYSQLI